MTSAPIPVGPFRRTLLRGLGAIVAASLVVLWILFVRNIFLMSELRPAPAAFMFPIFFFTLAVSGGVAAVRDEPIRVIIASALSLFPAGLLLAFIPGPSRLIAILDLALLVIGVLLLRSERDIVG
jgi:hypothetical protein